LWTQFLDNCAAKVKIPFRQETSAMLDGACLLFQIQKCPLPFQPIIALLDPNSAFKNSLTGKRVQANLIGGDHPAWGVQGNVSPRRIDILALIVRKMVGLQPVSRIFPRCSIGLPNYVLGSRG
jgi:hypothetical protein